MSRKRVDVRVLDNLIEHCERFSKKNHVKFHNYSKHQEVLRLQIIETSNGYKYLKTWLDTAYEEIITLKSQRGDLARLYEELLKTNLIKEFLDIASIQETFRLKFIEIINECQNTNGDLDVVKKNITMFKSEYNNLIQHYGVSLENNFAKEFPEYSRKLENLRLKFIETIDESKRLNGCLDEMFDCLTRLNSEQDNLRRRYNELLENNLVKEFLDYAKYQENLRLKFTEKSTECDCSKTCLDRANETITSLEFQLKEAHKMLTSALLQREKIEIERNSFDYLSEELCRLLVRYLRLTSSEKTRQKFMVNDGSMLPDPNFKIDHKSFDVDYSNTNVESDSSSISEMSISEPEIDVKDIKLDNFELDRQLSSYFDENSKDPLFVEVETPDKLPVTLATPANKSLEFSTLHSTDDNLPGKKPDVMKLPPETSGNSGSVELLEAPSSSRHTLFIQEPNPATESAIFDCDYCGESFQQKTSIIKYIRAYMAKSSSFRRALTMLKPKQKIFKCSICDRRLTSHAGKLRHEREVHQAEFIFGCNFCDSRFRRKEVLTYHLQTQHTFEKKFKCSKCGKAFARKQHMQSHLLVHTTKKPYQCPHCDLRFKDRESVRKHVWRIHDVNGKRYCCGNCDQRYRYKADLVKHIRRIHLS